MNSPANAWFLVSVSFDHCVRHSVMCVVVITAVCDCLCALQTGLASMTGQSGAAGFGFITWPPLMCMTARLSFSTQLWLQVTCLATMLPLLALLSALLSQLLARRVTWKGEFLVHRDCFSTLFYYC